MERNGMGLVVLVGLGAFALGAMMAGGAGAAAAGTGAAAAGAVLWPFFFLFKLAFFVLLFGFVGRMFWRGGWGPPGRRSGPWGAPWDRHDRSDYAKRSEADDGDDEPAKKAEDRFEDWHLMAHARMEVDRLAPEPADDDEAVDRS